MNTKKLIRFVYYYIFSIVLVSCSVTSDEPDPIPPPSPDEPYIPFIKWQWSKMQCKTYTHSDEIANFFHFSELHSGGLGSDWNRYERFSINQSMSIENTTDSSMTAILHQGWFDSSCLPGCSKKKRIAVPRIIPTKNDLKLNFRVIESNYEFQDLNNRWFEGTAKPMYTHICDSIGNNISSDIILNYDEGVFALSHSINLNDLKNEDSGDIENTFLSKFQTFYHYHGASEDWSEPQKFYYSFNSSNEKNELRSFITAKWDSETLSEKSISTAELFEILTNLKFLRKSDYYIVTDESYNLDQDYESMDRIMADKHTAQEFYDETSSNGCAEPYRVVLNGSSNECVFFINPDFIFFPVVRHYYSTDPDAIYFGTATKKEFLSKYKNYTNHSSPFPLYTPKQYDWMIEMLSALSPQTAEGVRMKYDLSSSWDYIATTAGKEELTFTFADNNLAKRFVKAYFSIFDDKENVVMAKKCISDNPNFETAKKEKLIGLIDKLPEIIDRGTNFNVSFNLYLGAVYSMSGQ